MNNSSLLKTASNYDNSPFVPPSKVEPDTITYSAQFYAKHHIPSLQYRPGNNTTNSELYHKYKTNYNLLCYNL